MSDRIVTPEFVRSAMSYDPDTGEFTWIKRLSPRGNPGAVVGSPTDQGYRMTRLFGKQYKLHRLAFFYMTGQWPDTDVDHINRNRSDNRWSNLRITTHAQNHQNRSKGKNNSSGVLGVCFATKVGLWKAAIMVNYKTINLGMFKDKSEAIAARQKAERELFTHTVVA